MTRAMSDAELDREIARFLVTLADDAGTAPPTASEVASRIAQRVGRRGAGFAVPRRLTPIALTGLLLVLCGALIGAAAWLQTRPPGPLSYEAVFLRLDLAPSRTVVVIGIDGAGQERVIARLPDTWAAHEIGAGRYLPPMGVVSPGGLLALPSERDALNMQWEIFDLRRPSEPPLTIPGATQFIELLRSRPYYGFDGRGGAFWGPGERLALLWYPSLGGSVELELTFVDGRTGATSQVEIPPERLILPFWASDGSGVLTVAADSNLEQPPMIDPRVLRPDGSLGVVDMAQLEPSCRTRARSGAQLTVTAGRLEWRDGDRSVPQPPLQVWYACLAPDDSFTVAMGGGSEGARTSGAVLSGGDVWHAIEGNFAGWLEVTE